MSLAHDLAFWNTFSMQRCLSLDAGGGAWPCLNVTSLVLLTPMGSQPLSECRREEEWIGVMDGGWGVAGWRGGGREWEWEEKR